MRVALALSSLLILAACMPVHADVVTDTRDTASATLSAPQGLWGEQVGPGKIKLSWMPPAPVLGGPAISTYLLHRATADDPPNLAVYTVPYPDTSYTDTGVPANHLYVYWVTAVHANGKESAPSTPIYVGESTWPPCSIVAIWVPPPYPGVAVHPQCIRLPS